MEKIKKFVKDHQNEIIVFTSGMIVGVITTRYVYERNLKYSINDINDNIFNSFTNNQGNFQRPDGTFPVPQIIKL